METQILRPANSPAVRGLVACVINLYGEAATRANEDNLRLFTRPFISRCIETAKADDLLSDNGKAHLDLWLAAQ